MRWEPEERKKIAATFLRGQSDPTGRSLGARVLPARRSPPPSLASGKRRCVLSPAPGYPHLPGAVNGEVSKLPERSRDLCSAATSSCARGRERPRDAAPNVGARALQCDPAVPED